MGKNLNMSAMDKLVSGLAGNAQQPSVEQGSGGTTTMNDAKPQETPRPSTSRRKKVVKKHICTNVDVEKLDKIKAIADMEGLNINAIFDLALSFTIQKYEQLHGTIQVKNPKKGDLRKVFNL